MSRQRKAYHHPKDQCARFKHERLESRIALAADFGQLEFEDGQAPPFWFDDVPMRSVVLEEPWFLRNAWNDSPSYEVQFSSVSSLWNSSQVLQIDQEMTEFDPLLEFPLYGFPVDRYLAFEDKAVDQFFAHDIFAEPWGVPGYIDSFPANHLDSEFAFQGLHFADPFTFVSEPVFDFASGFSSSDFVVAEQVAAQALELAKLLQVPDAVSVEFNPRPESQDFSQTIVSLANRGEEPPAESILGFAIASTRTLANDSLSFARLNLRESIDVGLRSAIQSPQVFGKRSEFEFGLNTDSTWLKSPMQSSLEHHNVGPPTILDPASADRTQMSERMRTLGMQLLREVEASAQNRLSQAKADSANSPARTPMRSGIVVKLDSEPSSSVSEAETFQNHRLFIGEPIAALHAYENFNIFEVINVPAPEFPGQSPTAIDYATLLPSIDLPQASRLILCVGTVSVFGYMVGRNHFSRDGSGRRAGSQIAFGHETFLENDSLNQTKPIVLKLSM